MRSRKSKSPSKKEKSPYQIKVAQIGLVSAIIVALIGLVGVYVTSVSNRAQADLSIRATELSLTTQAGQPVYIDIVKELQLFPNPISGDGYITYKVGEEVTATLAIENTGVNPATIQRFVVAVRGPNACDKDWNDQNFDFPGVGIKLSQNEQYSYTQSRSFDQPGVYFAEASKNVTGKGWAGVPPYHRIYFLVIDPNKVNTSSLKCVTPVPSETP